MLAAKTAQVPEMLFTLARAEGALLSCAASRQMRSVGEVTTGDALGLLDDDGEARWKTQRRADDLRVAASSELHEVVCLRLAGTDARVT
jgi:hypothetical protein